MRGTRLAAASIPIEFGMCSHCSRLLCANVVQCGEEDHESGSAPK